MSTTIVRDWTFIREVDFNSVCRICITPADDVKNKEGFRILSQNVGVRHTRVNDPQVEHCHAFYSLVFYFIIIILRTLDVLARVWQSWSRV